MTNIRIVHCPPDGGLCSITVPAPEFVARKIAEGLTEDEVIDLVIAKSVPPGDLHYKTTLAAIPVDRTFRNAWKADMIGESISIDMPVAKAIHKERIARQMTITRNRLRELLEIAEDLNNGQEIAALKSQRENANNRMSGIDAELDAITNEADLKGFWPEEVDEPIEFQEQGLLSW